ncbi:hypothetical protein CCMA1212_004057 [Trichoderma ghanense]|uniref:Uncharacterized protein n=1 Tax=Trichoderma ghanense TaxID=65468 RepID=A0ABY2H745_9HYPO
MAATTFLCFNLHQPTLLFLLLAPRYRRLSPWTSPPRRCPHKGPQHRFLALGSHSPGHRTRISKTPCHRALHPVLDLPLCGSGTNRPFPAPHHSEARSYLNSAPSSSSSPSAGSSLSIHSSHDLLPAIQVRVVIDIAHNSLPPSSKNSRFPLPQESAGCVASYSCFAASCALPVFPAAPPRHSAWGIYPKGATCIRATFLPPHQPVAGWHCSTGSDRPLACALGCSSHP